MKQKKGQQFFHLTWKRPTIRVEIPTNPFPGKNNLEKSAVQQELNQKKKSKIERKLASKFTITPPKEIIKINRDGTPESGFKLAAMSGCRITRGHIAAFK